MSSNQSINPYNNNVRCHFQSLMSITFRTLCHVNPFKHLSNQFSNTSMIPHSLSDCRSDRQFHLYQTFSQNSTQICCYQQNTLYPILLSILSMLAHLIECNNSRASIKQVNCKSIIICIINQKMIVTNQVITRTGHGYLDQDGHSASSIDSCGHDSHRLYPTDEWYSLKLKQIK